MKNIKFMILIAMLISIQIVLTLTPFGFVMIGPTRLTTLHIPTILAGTLLGVKAGAITGLSFGILSVIMNTVNPTLTSFVFSPFTPSVDGYQGNIGSLFIALVPRILLGVFAALIFEYVKKLNMKFLASTVAAVLATVIHTIMVLGLIYLIFSQDYASALGMSPSAVLTFLAGIIATNGVFEALLAGFLITALHKALDPVVDKMT